MESNLKAAFEHIDQALKNVDKLVHPRLWSKLNGLADEIDHQIEEDAAAPQD